MLHDLTLPVPLSTRLGEVILRSATTDDLDALMTLLADDPVSAARGDVADVFDRPRYAAALRAIVDDPANALLVAVDQDGRLVGTFQLTRIPAWLGRARPGCSSRPSASAATCVPAGSVAR